MRRRKRVYFTGTAETPIEQQLYWVSYEQPGAPVRVTEAAGTTTRDGQGRDPRADHAVEPVAAVADLSRRRQRASASPGSSRMRSTPSHPYAPYLDSHVQPTFGTHHRPGRLEALLPDAHAAAGAGQALSGLLLRLWRSARAAGDRRLVRLAAAARGAGRPGLDRLHDRQSRHQPPRDQVRKCGLSRDGRRRGQGPAGRRRMAQAAAVRRSVQDRGDGLVIWRLHDPEAAGEGAGRVRGGRRQSRR